MGGEEDTATFEDKLDAHINMVCRIQAGKGSGGARAEGWNWASSSAHLREGLFWGHGIQYGHSSLRLSWSAACSAGLLLLVKSGLWCQLPGLGLIFLPWAWLLSHPLSVPASAEGSGGSSVSGWEGLPVPAHITPWPHGLVTPNTQGTDRHSTCLSPDRGLQPQETLQLPQAGYSSKEGCLCK